VTPGALRDAVERVSGDPTIAARVRQVGAEMAAEGGTTAAADAIEALLERTR
jgi:UDP:flavonoid glycosyltransferase YjiC (YdhE family)